MKPDQLALGDLRQVAELRPAEPGRRLVQAESEAGDQAAVIRKLDAGRYHPRNCRNQNGAGVKRRPFAAPA